VKGGNQYNLNFEKRVEELVTSKFEFYQKLKCAEAPDHIYSVAHLKRGLIVTASSDNRLRFWVPGLSQDKNYMG